MALMRLKYTYDLPVTGASLNSLSKDCVKKSFQEPPSLWDTLTCVLSKCSVNVV